MSSAMTLEQMEAIMTDLEGRVAAIEDTPQDAIGVPNNYFINNKGKTVSGAAVRESGIALLENEREPAGTDYVKPGVRSHELLLAAGIEKDSIGALPEGEKEIALPGLFHGVPVPFTAIGPGILEVDFESEDVWVPTIQERSAGVLWSELSPTGLLLYQLKGTPGEEPTLTSPAVVGETQGISWNTYTSAGVRINGGAGFTPPPIKIGAIPASGVMYLIIDRSSHEKGAYPGLTKFATTLEKVNANPFEFPEFTLPEGFLYNIAAQFTFATKEAVSASGLMQVEIEAEIEPPGVPVQFAGGSDYGFTAAAEQTFEPILAGAVSLFVAPEQSTPALGGVSVLKLPAAPGNETEYAWIKQKLIIQQLEI